MPPRREENDKTALLQGTLDLMTLRTLLLSPQHGQGIARTIQQQSEDVFLVDHGSLYLCLQRLEEKEEIKGDWGVSENNRRARFYTITAKGKKQLTQKVAQWHKIARAMSMIIGPAETEA